MKQLRESPYNSKIRRISDKLANLKSSIAVERSEKINTSEDSIRRLENDIRESNDDLMSTHSIIADQVASLGHLVRRTIQEGEEALDGQFEQIFAIENTIHERLGDVEEQRKEANQRITSAIDGNFSSLKGDLSRELKKIAGDMKENMKKTQDNIHASQDNATRLEALYQDVEKQISETIDLEVSNLNEIIAVDKAQRDESEEAILHRLKDVTERLKGDLEAEKQERAASEDTLLKLLEMIANKIG